MNHLRTMRLYARLHLTHGRFNSQSVHHGAVDSPLSIPKMHDIVLCTLNARYWHSAFGLRYLRANMGYLRERTRILEFGIKDNTIELLGSCFWQNVRKSWVWACTFGTLNR